MWPQATQNANHMSRKRKSKRPFYVMAVSNDAPTFCLFVAVCSFDVAIKRFTEVWSGIIDNSTWIELWRGREGDGIPECVLRRGYNFRSWYDDRENLPSV